MQRSVLNHSNDSHRLRGVQIECWILRKVNDFIDRILWACKPKFLCDTIINDYMERLIPTSFIPNELIVTVVPIEDTTCEKVHPKNGEKVVADRIKKNRERRGIDVRRSRDVYVGDPVSTPWWLASGSHGSDLRNCSGASCEEFRHQHRSARWHCL